MTVNSVAEWLTLVGLFIGVSGTVIGLIQKKIIQPLRKLEAERQFVLRQVEPAPDDKDKRTLREIVKANEIRVARMERAQRQIKRRMDQHDSLTTELHPELGDKT